MRVELILEAIDRASAPIRAVQAAWKGLEAASNNGKLVSRVREAREAAAAEQSHAITGLLGAAATAGAIAAPIQQAVKAWNDYEDKLADIGLKGELAGQKLEKLGEQVRAQARALNTSSADLLKGINVLVEGGLDEGKATQVVAAVAKTVIATKAKIEDVGAAVVSFINNGKVGLDEVERGLGVLVQSAKDGNFEFNKMAHFLPRLTSLFASFGKTGVEGLSEMGAALQVINGVTNNAETSAAGLRDLLEKIQSDKAVSAFDDVGIGIKNVMQEAIAAGRPLEAIISALKTLTNGDNTKLFDIFGDVQARTAARALLDNVEKFEQLKNKALEAGNVIERDFNTRLALGVQKVQALNVAFTELGTTVGQALAPVINAKIDRIVEITYAFEAWAKANPELVRTIGEVALAVGTIIVVIAGLRLAFAVLKYSLITPIAWLLALPGAVGIAKGALLALGRVFLFLLSPVRLAFGAIIGFTSGLIGGISSAIAAIGGWGAAVNLLLLRLAGLRVGLTLLISFIAQRVATAFAALGVALLSTPFGLIIAGVAALSAAAYLLYRNWDQVGPWFAALWEGIKSVAQASWEGIVAFLGTIGARAAAALKSGWEGITAWFSNAWAAIGDVITAGIARVKTLFDFKPLEALKAVLDPVIAMVSEWGSSLGRVFAAIFEPISQLVSSFFGAVGAGFDRIGSIVGSISGSLFGPSASGVKATAEQAATAKAAIDAIAPAAQEAVTKTTAIFVGVSFYAQGVAMMQTLADGIRAGASAAVAAARDTVQQIRDHLPHSPAKVGPLSDLDQVQFGQTLATAIGAGAPRAVLAAQALAASLAATLPSAAAAADGYALQSSISARPSAGSEAGVSGSSGITINLTLSPNFSGGGGDDFVKQLRAALPGIGYELAEAIKAELSRRERTQH